MSDVEGVFARFRSVIAGQPDPSGPGGTVGLLRRVCEVAVQTLSACGAGVSVMARMRAYAYTQDRRLSDVARDIVARRLRLDPDQR